MSDEVWAICHASPNYMVSSMGRVKSLPRMVVGGRGGYRHTREMVLKPMLGSNGYLKVKIANRQHSVHSLVLRAFVGEPDGGRTWCAHGDGNRLNNALDNLRWATPLENSADTIKHGRSNRGAMNLRAKLTESDVLAIRKDPRRRNVIAKDYGVTPEAISHIVLRKNWGWL